ncbi:MAG: superoxide dismutase [Candidatus Dojkabacteria bacterium]|nr:MAG: superoxide dismutase [Candidatus Dojkabacteria bacterium]
MSFTLPKLQYNFDALEPFIDAQTMEIHHDKHHQGYTDKLNAAIEGTQWENFSIDEILRNIESIPEDIRQAVINNGGGFANHSLFWKIMTPGGAKEPSGVLREKIHETWSSFTNFKEEFSRIALSHFGSGWAWLVVNKNFSLDLYSTPNQDSPLIKGDVPILGLDVWEHAYYLKYQNRRAEYIDAWWNVVNWDVVSELYDRALS